jgi:aminoglycoside phosphotransferase (APT) family kinase protein
MSEPQALAAALASIVARHLGPPGDVHRLMRLTGGATKGTWAFDAQVGPAVLPLILQHVEPRAGGAGDATVQVPRVLGEQEAVLLAAAASAGVPVARVRAILAPDDGLGIGLITDRVEGETLGPRIIRDARLAAARAGLARQCGEILAALHRGVAPPAAPFLTEQGPASQLALYRKIYESFDQPQAAMEAALAWAAAHLPRGGATTVVHGDFRTGNFVMGPHGIRAVLDWEIAHVGDPMEDLGWLCVRTWRFGGRQPVGGCGRRQDLFEAYERAGGGTVDPARVQYWEAFGCIKWSIICMMKGRGHMAAGQRDLEQLAIGRRAEEPLWDFLELVHGAGGAE